MLKVKLEIESLIPETNCSEEYYLPNKLKGTVHFLRQTQNFPVNIHDQQGRFHIPIRLNHHKSFFCFQIFVASVEEFQNILASRFIVTLYEEEDEQLYAKGVTSAHDILGAVETDRCAFVKMVRF